MTCILQLALGPVPEQQRAQGPSLALALGVTTDHELRSSSGLDFHPCAGALAGLIKAVLAFGDDAFEAAGGSRSVELFGIRRDVNELDPCGRQQALRQIA